MKNGLPPDLTWMASLAADVTAELRIAATSCAVSSLLSGESFDAVDVHEPLQLRQSRQERVVRGQVVWISTSAAARTESHGASWPGRQSGQGTRCRPTGGPQDTSSTGVGVARRRQKPSTASNRAARVPGSRPATTTPLGGDPEPRAFEIRARTGPSSPTASDHAAGSRPGLAPRKASAIGPYGRLGPAIGTQAPRIVVKPSDRAVSRTASASRRLADPRLASHERDRHPAFGGPREVLLCGLELPVAADQGRAHQTAAHRADHAPASAARIDPRGPPIGKLGYPAASTMAIPRVDVGHRRRK